MTVLKCISLMLLQKQMSFQLDLPFKVGKQLCINDEQRHQYGAALCSNPDGNIIKKQVTVY